MPDLTQEIHKYAMESDNNLIVFVQTARSFDELRKNLISGFAKKLEEKLKEKYPSNKGWIVDATAIIQTPKITASSYLLSIRNEAWYQNLDLRIGIQNPIYYGVYLDKWQDHAPEIGRGIFRLLDAGNFGRSRSDKWCPWFIHSQEFADWSKEEALVSMRQAVRGESPAEILHSFCNRLVAIVEALDGYLKSVA